MALDLLDVQSPIRAGDEPANQIFRFATQMDIVRNYEVVLPVDDLLVGFVGRL